MPLEPKQQRFADEYIRSLNATQAAILAGYKANSANEQAARMLAKDSIRGEVDRQIAERRERTQVSQDEVVRELARVAFADPRAYFAWGPGGVTLQACQLLTDGEAAAVAEVSERKDGVRVKLHSKTEALKLLGQHLGMFTEKHEHTFPFGIPVSPEDAAAGRKAAEEYRRERLGTHHGTENANGSANGHAG